MTKLTDDLHELLESVDAGLLGEEELKLLFDAIEDSEVKHIVQQGVELVRLLESIDPDSVEGSANRPVSKSD